jgi:hypothetical protein
MMDSSTIAQPTLGNLHIRVPQSYNRQPVVSRLISRYNLTVNIAAACLEAHTKNDGWFHLELQGASEQVEAGLFYLQQLNVEIVQLNIDSLAVNRRQQLRLLCGIGNRTTSENSSPQIQDDTTKADLEVDITVVTGQTNRARFQVCIPKNYRSYPIIAGLVSCYGLTVNITAASLDNKTINDGWFDLEVWGTRQQIISGLRYLKKLGLQIWL